MMGRKEPYTMAMCLIASLVGGLPGAAEVGTGEPVVLENEYARYVIGADGTNQHFIDPRTGTDYCVQQPRSPFARVKKAGQEVNASAASYADGQITVDFGASGVRAVIGVTGEDKDAAGDAVKFYVDPAGWDTWSGTQSKPIAEGTDGPFATLQRARNAIREWKDREGGLTRPVIVEVGSGTYYLNEPLLLTPQDSGTEACPITYRAAPGAEVILSGGRPLHGEWQTEDGRIYFLDLPEVRDGGWFFRQLRDSEEQQPRARFPNPDSDDPLYSGYLYVPGPGFRGGGGFGFGFGNLQDRGAWLEYNVQIPSDGTYVVWVYYANNGAKNRKFCGFDDVSNRTGLSVDDGEPIRLDDLTDTGSFYAGFRWARSATLGLTAGRHTLRWVNVHGGALSLDALLLADDPAYQPEIVGDNAVAPPAAGRHVLLLQAETCNRRHDAPQFMVLDRERTWSKTSVAFEPGALAPFEPVTDAEVFLIPAWDWVSELVRVKAFDMQHHALEIEGANCMKPIYPGNRFRVENARAHLDTPGEWCLSRQAGRLYYWPQQPGLPQEVVVPVLDRVIDLRSDGEEPIHHIHIEGFTFRDTHFLAPETTQDVYFPGDAAVWLINATHCRIARNCFVEVGGYGVCLRGPCRDNEVVDNEIVGAGQGGIYLNGSGETPRALTPPDQQPARNLIAANRIHHCGVFYKHVAGVYLNRAHHNTVAHNRVTDLPRYGISLKHDCPGNVVEYNEVRRTNLETRDTGAIEMAENPSGSIIRYNLALDSVGYGLNRERGEYETAWDCCGIYLDNMSSNAVVTGNIVGHDHGAVWINWGRDNVIENNVFIGSRERLVRVGCKDNAGNRFERNIFYSTDPSVAPCQFFGWSQGQEPVSSDYNLFFCGGAEPEITGRPGGWAAWRKAGFDEHSEVADPLFVDAASDDYRLRPESLAWKMGFEPIDAARIGPAGWRGRMMRGANHE